MRRLTMSGHRRRAASYPVAAKRRSYVSPFCESKYWGRAFKSSKLAPERQRRPDRRRTPVLSDTGALCDTGREEPSWRHRILSIRPDSALDARYRAR